MLKNSTNNRTPHEAVIFHQEHTKNRPNNKSNNSTCHRSDFSMIGTHTRNRPNNRTNNRTYDESEFSLIGMQKTKQQDQQWDLSRKHFFTNRNTPNNRPNKRTCWQSHETHWNCEHHQSHWWNTKNAETDPQSTLIVSGPDFQQWDPMKGPVNRPPWKTLALGPKFKLATVDACHCFCCCLISFCCWVWVTGVACPCTWQMLWSMGTLEVQVHSSMCPNLFVHAISLQPPQELIMAPIMKKGGSPVARQGGFGMWQATRWQSNPMEFILLHW